MALGFNVDFLKKTAGAGVAGAKGAQGAQQAGANAGATLPNAIAGGDKSAQKADLGNMNTSELMKYVYNNKAGQGEEAQAQAGDKQEKQGNEKAVILPAVVEYNNEKFPANGQELDKVVDEIVKKTGDSKSKVESELKKKYANPAAAKTGTQLNMSA